MVDFYLSISMIYLRRDGGWVFNSIELVLLGWLQIESQNFETMSKFGSHMLSLIFFKISNYRFSDSIPPLFSHTQHHHQRKKNYKMLLKLRITARNVEVRLESFLSNI